MLVKSRVKLNGNQLTIDEIAIDLGNYDRVIVAGAGKASIAMAQGLEAVLGDRIDQGLLITKHGHSDKLERCRIMEAGHPVPDEASIAAGEAMLELASTVTERDLVLFLLSGGASALMEAPAEGVSLDDLQLVNNELLNSGASIMTMNTIRSRLSRVKAGGLAMAFRRATVMVMAMSDVREDNLNVIGSGPFVPTRRFPDMAKLLRAFELDNKFPPHLVEMLVQGDDQPEKISQPRHRIIGFARTMSNVAERVARQLDLVPLSGAWMDGEARNFPETLARKGLMPDDVFRNNTLIMMGETVVTKKGKGKGGRAQEMACAFATLIAQRENIAVLVAGTDGSDGPTDAAGALVDGQTVARAQANGFTVEETLADNNSYHFHQAAGSLVKTGPTGSNLNDILIIVRL